MANINTEPDQPVVRKTWTMIKKATPDYAQGMKIHFCGEDSLVDNAWVSRIDSNDKLTIASSKVS